MLVARPSSGSSRITALCDSGDSVGDLVHVESDRVGPDYVVRKVAILTAGAKPAIGIVVAKLTATRCIVQTSGEILGIYTGLAPGRPYFAGTDSKPTLTPPSALPAGVAYLQVVGVALAADVLRLQPQANMIVRTG